MSGAIGFLAAAVPTVATLIVGFRVINRVESASCERQIRKRMRDRADGWRSNDERLAKSLSEIEGKPFGFYLDELSSRRTERENVWLSHFGLQRSRTYSDDRDNVTLGPAEPSATNSTDQRILVTSGLIGVSLLILDTFA